MTTTSTDPIQISTHGEVGADEVEYARQKVAAALRETSRPVLFARAKLTRLADPALDRPTLVQANVDLDGRLVRAQVARPTMREAIDEIHDRLRDRLRREAGHWQAIRGMQPASEPDEWRHRRVVPERPPVFPRAAEDRRVLRRKSFGLPRMTVDQAAFDMHMLDYGFHLFTESGSGVDSVLYLSDDSAYRLVQLDPQPELVTAGETPVSVSPLRPPTLNVEEATDRLNVTGWPFVFFRDAATGRGFVVYHRFDGHYGLIVPVG